MAVFAITLFEAAGKTSIKKLLGEPGVSLLAGITAENSLARLDSAVEDAIEHDIFTDEYQSITRKARE